MALTRLTDPIEQDEEGNDIVTRRFGMWGTMAEIEICKKRVEVVHPDGKRKHFKTKEEAEVYMKTLI